MTRANLVVGILFVAFGTLVLLIIPYQVRSSAELIDSTFLPKATSYGLILLGAILAAGAAINLVRDRAAKAPATREERVRTEDAPSTREAYLPVVIVVAISLTYFFLMRHIGYLLSSIISLALYLLVFGERRPWMVALLAVVGSAVLYLVFAGIFYVRLP